MINQNWLATFYVIAALTGIVALVAAPATLGLQVIIIILLFVIGIYLNGIHDEAMRVRKLIEESEKE